MEKTSDTTGRKSALANIRARAANWLKKLKFINKPFTNGKQESESEKEIRETREEFKRVMEDFKNQTSLNVDPDKLTNAINNFQLYETKIFENTGYEDGLRGVKDKNIESSARARAAFIYDHTCSILEGRIKGLDNEYELEELRIKETESQISEAKGFNLLINNIYKSEHRHFSVFLGWIYVIIGLALMFADLPISLGIARYFIDLPIDFNDDFLSKITNPEIILFSLGVTFLSIYFKIIYDDYVNHSIIPDQTGMAKESFSTKHTIRLVLKLTVLMFLIYLLYNIGSMRNAMNEIGIKTKYPGFVSETQIFHYKLISFILSTILLPLLSGICLSIGFQVKSNIGNLRKSNDLLHKLKEEKRDIEKQKTNTAIQKNMLECLHKEWSGNKPEKLDNLKQLFANSYYQGHSRGFRGKFGDDIYDIARSSYANFLNTKN